MQAFYVPNAALNSLVDALALYSQVDVLRDETGASQRAIEGAQA